MTTISNKVRYYHSEMAGAPAISGDIGSLIAVLDACLVTGFGNKMVEGVSVSGGVATAQISSGHDFMEGDVLRISGATPAGLNSDWRLASVTGSSVSWSVEGCGIPDGAAAGTIMALRAPAGWEKVFEDANGRAAYRSLTHADHNGLFLYVDDSLLAKTARVRGYESMTDIDTGTGPFPTDAQVSGGLYWAKSLYTTSYARPWALVGDGRRFVFAPKYHVTYSKSAPALFFGRTTHGPVGDVWATAISGPQSEAYATNATPADNYLEGGLAIADAGAVVGGYMARDVAGAAGSQVVSARGHSLKDVTSGDGSYLPKYSEGMRAPPLLPMAFTTATPYVFRGFFAGTAYSLFSWDEPSAPSSFVLGTPGNGFAVLFATSGGKAWLMDLGTDGKWE